MKSRVLVAVVGLPLLLLVLLVLPAIATGLLVSAMSVVAVYELLFCTGLVKDVRLVVLSALMALFVGIWNCGMREWSAFLLAMWLYLMAVFGLMVASHAQLPFASVCMSVFSAIAVPMLLSSLTRLLTMDYGKFYILVPLALSFGTDSAAYFVGRAFGRHKMAPVVSPKKSWEGAAGGVAGCMVLMLAFSLFLELVFDVEIRYGAAVVYGLMGSVTCILGDLTFSAIKRQTGIKDYGKLLPGHGGILDRFDSMTLVAPLTEVLVLFLPLISQ